MEVLHPSYVVGIGGSAGGLAAYKELLTALPPDTGMAFVVIAHLSPTWKSMLPEILSLATRMPVVQAADEMPVLANRVYVIPPNADLCIKHGVFTLVSPRTLRGGRHKQVDFFLASLAKERGARAIGVIFSGADGDGTDGCKLVKAAGGVTFAQDFSAQFDSMPQSAIASGYVDFVQSPADMADELTRISACTAQPD